MRDNFTTLQDAVMKLNRCVVEIKMKFEFEDGRSTTHEHVVVVGWNVNVLMSIMASVI